jgi:prepilin-type N-terminal cleavage/methylation domain-containing protein
LACFSGWGRRADRSGDIPDDGFCLVSTDRSADSGFTLVELMITLAIFALIITGVAAGMNLALDLTRSNRQRSTAAYLATDQLERARAEFNINPKAAQSTAYPSPPPSASTRVVDGTTYSITQTMSWVNPRTNQSACAAQTSTASGQVLAYQRVRAEVSWPNLAPVRPVVAETLLTPTVDPNVGHLSVSVADRDGNAVVGRWVTITGPRTQTMTITDEGCAFFAELGPGSYEVTFSATGWVDQQGTQPVTQLVGVSGGAVTAARLTADQDASIRVTPVPGSGGGAVPDAMQVTVANTGLSLQTKAFAWAGSAPTIGPLFPFTSGYRVWAGGCVDADPSYTGYGGTRPARVAPSGPEVRSGPRPPAP